MAADATFRGMLRFGRELTIDETIILWDIIEAGADSDDDGEPVNPASAPAEFSEGKRVVWGDAHERADSRGYITCADLDPLEAFAFNVDRDGRGLIHAGESYGNPVAGLNFIIVNANQHIPDFRLYGDLIAEDVTPGWLIRVGPDGWARRMELPEVAAPPPSYDRIRIAVSYTVDLATPKQRSIKKLFREAAQTVAAIAIGGAVGWIGAGVVIDAATRASNRPETFVSPVPAPCPPPPFQGAMPPLKGYDI